MPRQTRIDVPRTVYHVYTRGHNKSAIFLDDQDRYVFMKYLKRAYDQCPWELLGYCLMNNHYHLQVKTLDEPLSRTMHYLNTLYAGYFNFRYGKVGHLFQNRFHSIPVEIDTYLLVLSRYIHLNPVVAGIVKYPQDYRWSSYAEYIGMRFSGLLQCDLVLDTLSANRTLQKDSYRKFVENEIGKAPRFTEDQIRKTRIFGTANFIRSMHREPMQKNMERNITHHWGQSPQTI